MPTLLIWRGYKFRSLDVGEPPHVHIVKDGKSLKIWPRTLEIASNRGYNERQVT